MRLSFVIPVYNASLYLMRCLESIAPILTQGHEAIIVDDGSTDVTPNILKEFSKSYTSVHVITQDNQGQSVARNVGIQHATGDYIWFLDADDYLDNPLPDILIQTLAEGDSDVVVVGRMEEYKDRSIAMPPLVSCRFTSGIDYFEQANWNAWYRTQPWDKIVRRTLLMDNKICFEPGKMFEDMFYCLQLFVAAHKTVQLAIYPYHYVLYNEGSLTQQVRPVDRDGLIAVEQATAYLQNHNVGLKPSDGAFQILIYTFLSSCLLKKYIPLSFKDLEALDMVDLTMKHPLFRRAVSYCAKHPSIGLQRWGMALCIWLSPRLSRYVISGILGRK